MLGFSSKQLIGTGIFLFAIFIGVPLVIGATAGSTSAKARLR